MAVYVIVIAVAVLGLVACYRAFGGGQVNSPDAATLLSTAHQSLRRSLEHLDAVLAAGRAEGAAAPTASTLRTGRQSLGAAQHCLDLMPGDSALAASQQAARALLAQGVDDIAWAWRIVASETWVDNDGLGGAIGSLRADAVRCTEDARPLLAAPSAEPAKGP